MDDVFSLVSDVPRRHSAQLTSRSFVHLCQDADHGTVTVYEKTHEGGVCYSSSQGVVNKTSFVTTYIPGVAPISSRTSRSRKLWNFQHGTREDV